MTSVLFLPLFGIIITIACYSIGLFAKKLIPSLSIPPIVSNTLLILFIVFTPVTLEQYMVGGRIITMFMGPVTVILAMRIYNQREQLKANIIPVLGGCIAGSSASLLCVWFVARLFDLDSVITMSVLPKSVTSPIAMELAARSGGIEGLALAMVQFTGLVGAAFSPFFIKIFKLKDPIATGIAIGSSGHAIATAAAIKIGETEAAMSGLAIPLMGIITSIIWIIVF